MGHEGTVPSWGARMRLCPVRGGAQRRAKGRDKGNDRVGLWEMGIAHILAALGLHGSYGLRGWAGPRSGQKREIRELSGLFSIFSHTENRTTFPSKNKNKIRTMYQLLHKNDLFVGFPMRHGKICMIYCISQLIH